MQGTGYQDMSFAAVRTRMLQKRMVPPAFFFLFITLEPRVE